MTDENTVNDIVEKMNDLRCHQRQGLRQNDFPDRTMFKICLRRARMLYTHIYVNIALF